MYSQLTLSEMLVKRISKNITLFNILVIGLTLVYVNRLYPDIDSFIKSTQRENPRTSTLILAALLGLLKQHFELQI